MAQPTPYTRQNNFAAYQAANPAAPYVGSQHDADFNAVMVSLNQTITNIGLIQRDDGELVNGLVTPDSLNQATINMIGEWNPRGIWATATNYAVRDMVTPTGGTVTYVCAVAHTSGATFAGDDALGYWQPVNGIGTSPITPAQVTFSTNNVLLGRATAGAGGGEEIACTAFARTVLDDATAGAAATTLGLGVGNNVTFNSVTTGAVQVTGLLASTMLYLNATQQITATAAPTDGQLLIGDSGGVPLLGGLTGTANQVVVTNGAGTITLSTPQDIGTGSTPTFATVNVTSLASGQVVFAGASSALTGSNSFVWDAATTRLGIGTSSPAYALEIRRTAANAAIRIAINSPLTGMVIRADGGFLNEDETIGFTGIASGFLVVPSDAIIGWTSAVRTNPAGIDTASCDTRLVRDAANVVAMQSSSNSQTFRVYRTFTDASNYERVALQSGAGYFELAAETAGTGTDNIDVRITPSGAGVVGITNNLHFRSSFVRIMGDFSNATRANRVLFADATTNNNTNVGIIPNGTGIAATLSTYSGSDPDNAHIFLFQATSTAALINVVAAGTGTLRALELQVNNTSRFLVNTSGVCNVAAATATPANGSSTACLLFGTTAGFGIYYGSGGPTVSAGQGSLYLRSDGSSIATRAYINTDGGTTWTAVTTAT